MVACRISPTSSVIALVSKSEADCRILREVAGRLSQSVVGFPDAQQARKAIQLLDPEIINLRHAGCGERELAGVRPEPFIRVPRDHEQ